MADTGPIIETRQVIREFGQGTGRVRVLHEIDLTVEPGELTAIIGPSGSGKSTLLNILGLLDRPTSGQVIVDGHDVASLDDQEITRLRGDKIGFVFQFHHLLPAFSAVENVMLPLMARHSGRSAWMKERALSLLTRMGLGPYVNRSVVDLSGGQQQRVAIARSLASRPKLVLADEPTGNLDTASSRDVFALLNELNQEQRMAVMVVTHDPRIADTCQRISKSSTDESLLTAKPAPNPLGYVASPAPTQTPVANLVSVKNQAVVNQHFTW